MIEGATIFQGDCNGAEIVIRHVRRDDVELLLNFINIISKEKSYILFQGEQMSLEEESRYIEGFIKKAENHTAVKLLVFHNNEFIGLADITMKDKAESHIGILGIIIGKEWRNKKIGKFLMQKIIEEAQKNIPQLQIITLTVFANNPVAKQLYEKMGFITYGLLPNGLKHKGVFVDNIYMYKSIAKG